MKKFLNYVTVVLALSILFAGFPVSASVVKKDVSSNNFKEMTAEEKESFEAVLSNYDVTIDYRNGVPIVTFANDEELESYMMSVQSLESSYESGLGQTRAAGQKTWVKYAGYFCLYVYNYVVYVTQTSPQAVINAATDWVIESVWDINLQEWFQVNMASPTSALVVVVHFRDGNECYYISNGNSWSCMW